MRLERYYIAVNAIAHKAERKTLTTPDAIIELGQNRKHLIACSVVHFHKRAIVCNDHGNV